jgi:hypothetical protein
VAWAEGGVLRAGSFATPSDPLVRDDPPTAFPSRWPRFIPWSVESGGLPVLVFVETGPAGDRLAALRRGPQGWSALPPPNDVVSAIVGLQVSGSVVTILDTAGGIHLVRLN